MFSKMSICDKLISLIYNKFGQSLKLLGRVVTMEMAIYTPILTSLTLENRSKMNEHYKFLVLLPHWILYL